MATSSSPIFRPGLMPFSTYSSCSAMALLRCSAAAKFAGPAPTNNTSISICSLSLIVSKERVYQFAKPCVSYSTDTKKGPVATGPNSKQENCELINVEVVLYRFRDRLGNSVDLFRFELDLPRCGDSFFC